MRSWQPRCSLLGVDWNANRNQPAPCEALDWDQTQVLGNWTGSKQPGAGTQARPTSMPKTGAEGKRQTAWLLECFFFFLYFTVSSKAVFTVLQLLAKGSSRGSHPCLNATETRPLGWASMSCRQDMVVGWGWESLQNTVLKHRACRVLVLLWPNLDSITHNMRGTSWWNTTKVCVSILKTCFDEESKINLSLANMCRWILLSTFNLAPLQGLCRILESFGQAWGGSVSFPIPLHQWITSSLFIHFPRAWEPGSENAEKKFLNIKQTQVQVCVHAC